MELNMDDVLNYKGTPFWKGEIKKAGVENEIGPFDSIMSWKNPPGPNSGYGEPILQDVILDGKKTDIYRANVGKDDTEHSIYLHVKG